MIVRPVGARALLVELADGAEARALAAECRRRADAGQLEVDDIVPGARTVLLDGVSLALAESLPRWHVSALADDAAALVEIPVTFDGPDIAEVARLWDTGIEAVPRLLLATELTVAFCGFSPGFAYLSGLGRSTPRRSTPRTRVPAGAVAVAGEYAGVYPSASPGGWQLLGTTDAVLWDPDRSPAALLAPGTRVRFVEAGAEGRTP